MNWTLVPLADTPPQPWRNGGGSTRELLAWPSPVAWRVRLSVADVTAPGPFSRFEGVERWFAVLEGDGVVLQGDFGAQRLTAAGEPFRFDGARPVDCRLLGGATRDFNLMAAPGQARMRRVRGEFVVAPAAGALLAVYAHAKPARVTLADERFELPPFHLAWQRSEHAAQARVTSDDALWMEAMP